MKRRLKKDEVRVIKLSREGIAEILWETFMEVYHDYLDIPNDDYHVCHMTVNEDMSELIFYSCYSAGTQRPDFNVIDSFLKTEALDMTESIYSNSKYTTLQFADGFRKVPRKKKGSGD